MFSRKTQKLIGALCLLTAFTANSGCFGSFMAVRKVWEFNKEISGNKFVQWAVFLGLIIIPVYALFSLGDALIFNSVEFWTDSNPLASNPGAPAERIVRISDEETLHMVRDRETGAMTSTLLRNGVEIARRVFTPVEDGIVVTDETGARVARIRQHAGGALSLFGAGDGELIGMTSAEEAGELHRAYQRGGAAELARVAGTGPRLVSASVRP